MRPIASSGLLGFIQLKGPGVLDNEGSTIDEHTARFLDMTSTSKDFKTIGQVFSIGNWLTKELRLTITPTGYGEDGDLPGLTGDGDANFN